jgi:glucokinase
MNTKSCFIVLTSFPCSFSASFRAQGDDVGKIIAEGAAGRCPICVEVMDIFASTYGAETGNLALKTIPTGGIFIAGGIAAKNMSTLKKNDQYVQAYLQKGRMRPLLKKIPIYLITHKEVGLLGSKVICRRIIHAAANTKQIKSKL